MISVPRLTILMVMLGTLGGCDREPVEETVFDDQINTLDKARDVEKQLMDRAEKIGKELEDKDEEEP